MDVFHEPQEILEWSRRQQVSGAKVGLVPTMGYLHEGHLSLVRLSLEDRNKTVVSIYVNPTQFGPGEDFERYPRDEERDLELLEREGVDAVLLPTSEIMYPPGYATFVKTDGPSEGWCGASRPVHFRGVTTIVAQLFNLSSPQYAYFGQKDAQQVAVIRRMTRDLKFPVQIVVGEIIRESDGLAMSSRNTYLSQDERAAALILYRSLCSARQAYQNGERSGERMVNVMRSEIESERLARLDYVGVVDRRTFRSVEDVSADDLLIGAIFVGPCRLIDNMDVGARTYPLRG